MGVPLPLLAATCLASAAAWALLAARRARAAGPGAALTALACGGVAAGLALGAYQALEVAGLPVRWSAVTVGGWSAAGFAAVIGLVEEGAKLVGITLAAAAGRRVPVAAATVGVSAGFAAVESGLALGGAEPGVALLRALLAPAAHAILAAPLGAAVLLAARGRRGALAWLTLGLLTAAGLHGAADLALSVPGWGRLGYAAALLAPALALHLLAPRPAPAAARR